MNQQTVTDTNTALLPTAVLGIPISATSLQVVKEIVEGLHSKFSMSENPKSSFYPKVTVLSYKDFLSEKRENVRASVPENENLKSAVISSFRRTEQGLVLMDLDFGSSFQQFRIDVARNVQSSRETPVEGGDFGFKYFNEPSHLMVGMEVLPEAFEVFLAAAGEFVGKSISFESPCWILRSSNWSEQNEVELL